MLDPHAHTRFHKISAEPGSDASHLALTDSVPGRILNGNLTVLQITRNAVNGQRTLSLSELSQRATNTGMLHLLTSKHASREDLAKLFRRRVTLTSVPLPPNLESSCTCALG